MAKAISSLKSVSFVYDFAVDGGAQTTIPMGVFIPINSVVWLGFANSLTTVVGVNATIAVGWTGSTGALMTATAITSFAANAIVPGVDLPGAPVKATAGRELAVTIATADITAGKFLYVCYYAEFNQ